MFLNAILPMYEQYLGPDFDFHHDRAGHKYSGKLYDFVLAVLRPLDQEADNTGLPKAIYAALKTRKAQPFPEKT